MKCTTVKDELSRYVEGELPRRLQAAMAQHLAACPACRAEAEGYRRAEEALRSLAAVVPAPDLSADLRRRLSAVSSRPRPLRWLWAGTALAAVAAAAALLALRAPAPVSSPQAAVRGSAEVESHPPQYAARPVTEEDGALRPTAPPAPSLAGRHEQSAGRRGSARHPDHHSRVPVRRDLPEVEEARSNVAAPAAVSADDRHSRFSNLDSRPSPIPDSRPPTPDGVVLLVAAPQPPRPSSSYYGEVTLPDGGTSTYQETVERNAAGESQSVKIAYQETPPPAGAGSGG